MKLRILGSAGAEFLDFKPPAFLIDDHLLLDAGTIGAVLTEEEQWNLRHIFITHSHLDYIRGIPALADNIIIKNLSHSLQVYGTAAVISALRDHLFNDAIWPDFTRLPNPQEPVLKFNTITAGQQLACNGYNVMAIDVDHTVPAVGYIVSLNGARLAYTGDTGPTEEFWHYASGVDALIVEVSFPDSMTDLALLTKHLTCSLLKKELQNIVVPPKRILITHPKPKYYDLIRSEVARMGVEGIELLHDGMIFNI